MDGTQGAQAEKTRAFVDVLKSHLEIPVEFRDERLSTVSARELMQATGKKSRVARYDAAAAALILQSYLDNAARRPPDDAILPPPPNS
jgi:putative Holliday junction resolvase